jgi:hypothetical protein
MTSCISSFKKYNETDFQTIRPGPVGSVGDVLGMIRFKHSFPNQGLRFDPSYIGNKQNRLGSNVSDGNHKSFTTGGRGDPFVIDEPWNGHRHQKVKHGTIIQDLRAPDKLHQPYLGSLPQLSWQNQIATVYNAKRTGNMFLPLPGPYQLSPGEVPRGGATPVITARQTLEYGDPLNPSGTDLQTTTAQTYNTIEETKRKNAYYQSVYQKINTGRPDVERTRMF